MFMRSALWSAIREEVKPRKRRPGERITACRGDPIHRVTLGAEGPVIRGELDRRLAAVSATTRTFKIFYS